MPVLGGKGDRSGDELADISSDGYKSCGKQERVYAGEIAYDACKSQHHVENVGQMHQACKQVSDILFGFFGIFLYGRIPAVFTYDTAAFRADEILPA